VPTFFVSSFNLSATSNEVVLIGNELFPTWSGEGAAQPPVLRPRLVLTMDAAMKIAALPIVAETAPTIGWTADSKG
jgi:hypothetical protein